MAASPLACEAQTVWTDKWRHDDAECKYQMSKHGVTPAVMNEVKKQCAQTSQNTQSTPGTQSTQSTPSSLVSEIAKARQHIQNSLKGAEVVSSQVDNVLASRLEAVELENKDLRKVTEDLQAVVKKLEARISALEVGSAAPKVEKPVSKEEEKAEPSDDDDDDIDLFGSDDEEDDEEAEKIKAERLAAYQAKKTKKPVIIAKSNVILDVKPWDDETDMAQLEKCVRSVTMDGLMWGTGKLVPVGYGIKKLTISSVVVDEKVSLEDVEEKILEFEDLIQSVDIAAFNKI